MHKRLVEWAFPLLIAALIVFTIMIRFTVSPDMRIQIMDCLLVSIGVAVIVGYTPTLFDIEPGRLWTRSNMLAIGILLTWVSTTFMRSWWFIFRVNDSPDWMRDQHDFALMVNAIGGLFHLAAPNVIDGRLPLRSWIWIGCALGGGLLPLMVMTVFEVDALYTIPYSLVLAGMVFGTYRWWKERIGLLNSEDLS